MERTNSILIVVLPTRRSYGTMNWIKFLMAMLQLGKMAGSPDLLIIGLFTNRSYGTNHLNFDRFATNQPFLWNAKLARILTLRILS